jgi:hypothetical protein
MVLGGFSENCFHHAAEFIIVSAVAYAEMFSAFNRKRRKENAQRQ